MRRIWSLTLLLGALASVSGAGVVLADPQARILAAVALAGVAILQLPWQRRPAFQAGAGVALLILAGLGSGRLPGLEGSVWFVALATAGLAIALGHPRGLDRHDALGTLLFGGVLLAAAGLDPLWHALQAWGRGASAAAGLATVMPPRWGPTAAGVYPCLAALCLLVCGAARSSRTWRVAVAALAIAALPAGVVLLGVRGLTLWMAENATFRSTHAFLVQLLALPAAALLVAWARGPAADAPVAFPGWFALPRLRRAAALPLAGLAVLAIAGAAAEHGPRPVSADRPRRILFLDREAGGSSFEEASWKRIGLMRTGLYSLLARDLRRTGHEVVVSKDTVSAEALREVSVVVMIVPGSVPAEGELGALREFVSGGGGLLVLADHTDLKGHQAPTNTILAPYGMELRFDTAMETARNFDGNLEVRRTGVLPPSLPPRDLQVLHGASLRIRGPARPVVVGRRMWSDFGDLRNAGRGAFLGDYKFWPASEPAGDLVLVASAESGAGRVLAFGDTSTFQSVAIGRSCGAIRSLFAWLEGGGERDGFLPAGSLSLAAALAALLVVAGLLPWRRAAFASLAGACLLPAACLVLGDAPRDASNLRALEGLPPRSSLVLHGGNLPAFDTDQFQPHSIEGLLMCGEREGLLSTIADLRHGGSWKAARAVFVVAPLEPLGARLCDELDEYLRGGGLLVVSAGFEERAGVAEFLARHGISIRGMPLGDAPYLPITQRNAYRGVQCVEAWPLEISAPGEGTRTLFEVDGLPIIVSRKVGDGTLIVVGDSWFFTDANLEGEEKFREANIDLLCRMLGHAEGLAECRR